MAVGVVTFGADTYYPVAGTTVRLDNGDGTFADVTEAAGVGDPRWSTGA